MRPDVYSRRRGVAGELPARVARQLEATFGDAFERLRSLVAKLPQLEDLRSIRRPARGASASRHQGRIAFMKSNPSRPYVRLLKPAIDRVAATVAIVLFAPVLIALAVT